ncbi:MAG TPA: J domain-containing protein [Phycisphaerae bacterium]|nr:J domain-containing protein [Phycisphaerae bacterium]
MDLHDCYEILGLPPGGSPAEIRRAYKRQVFKCHPDRTPGDSGNHAQFCRITAAYAKLRAAGFNCRTRDSEKTCSACGNVEEIMPGMNGFPRCSECLLDRRRKRLPAPQLRPVRCLAVIGLQALAAALLARSVQTESNTPAFLSAGVLLAAMFVLSRDVCRSVLCGR